MNGNRAAASESLRAHFHEICSSNIPSYCLASRLFSVKLISKSVHNEVTDDHIGHTDHHRIQTMLKAVTSSIDLRQDTFEEFVKALSEDVPTGKILADNIMNTYEGTQNTLSDTVIRCIVFSVLTIFIFRAFTITNGKARVKYDRKQCHNTFTTNSKATLFVTSIDKFEDKLDIIPCNPCLCKLVRLFEASGREGI